MIFQLSLKSILSYSINFSIFFCALLYHVIFLSAQEDCLHLPFRINRRTNPICSAAVTQFAPTTCPSTYTSIFHPNHNCCPPGKSKKKCRWKTHRFFAAADVAADAVRGRKRWRMRMPRWRADPGRKRIRNPRPTQDSQGPRACCTASGDVGRFDLASVFLFTFRGLASGGQGGDVTSIARRCNGKPSHRWRTSEVPSLESKQIINVFINI